MAGSPRESSTLRQLDLQAARAAREWNAIRLRGPLMASIGSAPALTRELAGALQQRQSELRRLLQEKGPVVHDSPPEVIDLKELAEEGERAAIDEVTRSHAEAELQQVVAALRRIEEGTYGSCLDCGETIAEHRLRALPATAFCLACQAKREHAGTPRR